MEEVDLISVALGVVKASLGQLKRLAFCRKLGRIKAQAIQP
jgi:hypothetical protein